MDIHPQLLSLHRLLAGRLFRIPQYQRAYSWTKKERTDLFEDLEKLHSKPGTLHFMATIVGLQRESRTIATDEFHVTDVVDGQQRLTTLVLVLRAIESALNGDVADELTLRSELRSLLVKADKLSLVLLQTNHDTSGHCLTYLREGTHARAATATTLADRRLLQAMEDCEVFVERWTDRGRSLIDLTALLKNRLQFILHEITDESLVYTVFEVLNSRGMAVAWLDRLKSALMGVAFDANTGNSQETIDELHGIWRDIYACIGIRQGMSTEALRFAATLRAGKRPSKLLDEEAAAAELTSATRGSAKGVVDVSRWILRVARAVDALMADHRRGGASRIKQARLLAVAILLRDDLTDHEQSAALSAWEKVSFRIYGMIRKDARTKVGDYVRLAWACERQQLTAEGLSSGIRTIGDDYPIEDAIEAIRDIDCYSKWQADLRYFMFRYEEHLAKRRGQKFANEQWSRIWRDSAARSIEHICPQSKGARKRSDLPPLRWTG